MRKIYASRSDIGAQQNSILFLAKGEIYSHSFFLLLMSLEFVERRPKFEFSKGLIQETNLLAGRKKDNYFLFRMAFQEGVESIDFILRIYDHIILSEL